MIRKILVVVISLIAIFGLLKAIDAGAAAFPTGVGGTGTTFSPAAGQVLVGTGSSTYTPAYLLCAGTCSISSASGTVTITGTGVATNTGNWAGTWQLYNPSDFLSSSTPVANTVNGGSGTVTITSSSLSVVWPTVNGDKASAYQITAGTGATSTVSGATTTISVSLNNGSAVTCSANQFLDTISATGTAQCGSITFPTAPTYTFSAGTGISISQATSSSNTTTTVTLSINSGSVQNCTSGQLVSSLSSVAIITCQIAVQAIDGVNTSTISFVAGTGIGIATTSNSITFSNVGVTTTTGNWTGTWQGANSTTFYLASNPSGYLSSVSTTIPTSYVGSLASDSSISFSAATGTGITAAFLNPLGFITTSTNNFGGLTGNGTTTYVPVYTAAGTLAGYANLTWTSSTNTLFVNGTSTYSKSNASGSWNYSLANDGNYLDISNTGTIPGTNPVPYNIVLQKCPPAATTSTAVTSSSWECDWSESETLPDGSTDFLDLNFQYYPTGTSPNQDFGLFDNARGTSSQLFPFDISYNNGSTNAVPLKISPTAGATSTSQFDGLFSLGTNGQFVVGSATGTTGDFVVNENGASTCAGIYDSSASTIYGLTDSLPAPSGCTALGGYYHGLGVGGSTSSTGSPIFGVLAAGQSSNGRGNTGLTVYDTNEVDTYNNQLDDGSGNAFFKGNLGVGTSTHANTLDVNASADVRGNLAVGTTTTSTATLNVNGTTAIASTTNIVGPLFVGTSTSSSVNVPSGSLDVENVISSGAMNGGGQVRSYQDMAGDYVALYSSGNKSGFYRSSTNDWILYYDTSSGNTVLDSTFAGAPILFQYQDTTKGRMDPDGDFSFLSAYVGSSTATSSITLQVTGSTSSTIRIGKSAATSNPGCIEMYDSVNSSTLEYLYFANGLIVGTSTKPSFCE